MPRKHPQIKQKEQVRHTHSTIAALEDIISILLDVVHELSNALQYAQARMSQAMSIARKTREGPHAYDAETPNTRTQDRKKFKRRT